MTGKKSPTRQPGPNTDAWLKWGLLIGWMGLIFFLSHQPDLPGLPGHWLDTVFKKLAHASAYAILMTLWWRALNDASSPERKILWPALGLTILYAITDEWHQTFVPGRSGQLADVLVDTAGALLALIIIRRLRPDNPASSAGPAPLTRAGLE